MQTMSTVDKGTYVVIKQPMSLDRLSLHDIGHAEAVGESNCNTHCQFISVAMSYRHSILIFIGTLTYVFFVCIKPISFLSACSAKIVRTSFQFSVHL